MNTWRVVHSNFFFQWFVWTLTCIGLMTAVTSWAGYDVSLFDPLPIEALIGYIVMGFFVGGGYWCVSTDSKPSPPPTNPILLRLHRLRLPFFCVVLSAIVFTLPIHGAEPFGSRLGWSVFIGCFFSVVGWAFLSLRSERTTGHM